METPQRLGNAAQREIDQDLKQLAASIKLRKQAHREAIAGNPRPFRRLEFDDTLNIARQKHPQMSTEPEYQSHTARHKRPQRGEALHAKMNFPVINTVVPSRSMDHGSIGQSNNARLAIAKRRPPTLDDANNSSTELEPDGRKTYAKERLSKHLLEFDTKKASSNTKIQQRSSNKRKDVDEYGAESDQSSDAARKPMRKRRKCSKRASIQALRERHALRRLPVDELLTTTEKLRGPDDDIDALHDENTRELSQDPILESTSSAPVELTLRRGKLQRENLAQISAKRAEAAVAGFDLYFKPKYLSPSGSDESFEYSAARCSDGFQGTEREQIGKVMPTGRNQRKLRQQKKVKRIHIRELPTCSSRVSERADLHTTASKDSEHYDAAPRTSHCLNQQLTVNDVVTTAQPERKAHAQRANDDAKNVSELQCNITPLLEGHMSRNYMDDSQASYHSDSQGSDVSIASQEDSSFFIGSCTQALVEDHIVSLTTPLSASDLEIIRGKGKSYSLKDMRIPDVSINSLTMSRKVVQTTPEKHAKDSSELEQESDMIFHEAVTTRPYENQDEFDDSWRPREPMRTIIRMEVDEDIMASPLVPEPRSTLVEELTTKCPDLSAPTAIGSKETTLFVNNDKYSGVSKLPKASGNNLEAPIIRRGHVGVCTMVKEIPETQEEVYLPRLPSLTGLAAESADPFGTNDNRGILHQVDQRASTVKRILSYKVPQVKTRNFSLTTPVMKHPSMDKTSCSIETPTRMQTGLARRPSRMHTTLPQKSLSDLTRQNSKRYGTIPSSEIKRTRSYAPLLSLAPRFK